MGNQTTTPASVKKSSALYMGMKLNESSQQLIDSILADLGIDTKETYINHHITVVFSPAWQHCAFAGLNAFAEVTGVLVNDTHVVIETGEVRVESWDGVWNYIRPSMDLISDVTGKGRKGQMYHVTHSLVEGAKAKDSNLLLSGDVESKRHEVTTVLSGKLFWANSKGSEFESLENLKKCPELQVGAGRTIFTGIGSYHSGDGGYDFLGSFGEDIRLGLVEMAYFPNAERPYCGCWPMSKAVAECTRIGMVRPAGREVYWEKHRDDLVPVVKGWEVTEQVSKDTSSVITYSLPIMLLDGDDEHENGPEVAKAEKERLIRSNCQLFAISVIANGSDVPDAPPPTVHRCLRKVENGEPLKEGEIERAKAYWYTTENPEGWVLVDYNEED